MVDLLGDYLTLVFLFDQEIVLGSQYNGTNPICRSSGHSPRVRSVNWEDTNAMKLLMVSTLSTFQVTHF